MPSDAPSPPHRPDDSAWTHHPAPAKLNLFLHITGRRPDGYHLLQTVFQLLDWGDDIALRVRDDGRIVRTAGPHDVPPEHDLTVRAARALQAATGTSLGADIAITKRIPAGGGFGGGSSDAATVLVMLNRRWNTGLGPDALAAIGLALGADVPVFVHGRSAWAEGVGERLVPLDLPPRWYLLVDSGVHVPTATLFQAPDLTREAPSATISDFVSGHLRGNVFAPVLRRRDPRIAEALDALSAFGEAQVTGTGGGLFVAFDNPVAAQAACDALAPRWRVRVARGIDRSPLLQDA
ncbi:4-(cytidine 5'-diphospho)-2-C-methyl-D-erythritol kinase [Chiayiivirga flava]|uniref:4-diphosphocytidyl-2-C-methyl-D-erythritol kinase n=1 Tax=Chiayiivirga flava TaxID=659595 RepID=A0A7W8D717_9GAMM|nr:4-(cytidine 5'-diphospho)-2-C-methyl-D-erythritol kinase [Chiayiivirga flava]MBB5209099.1 4-diphosphocytidyl-2-C-methyl-D-erythritol kinase [Chiayiivirga flava]